MKPKAKSQLEKDIFRVIINTYPKRSPEGQVKEIMKLIKEDLKNS